MSGKSRFNAQFGGGGGGGGGLKELEVGVTPIIGGTVGRLLFEGTGNVLGESNGLVWDITNSRLGIRTTTPDCTLDVHSSGTSNARGIQVAHVDNTTAFSQAKFIGRRSRGTEASPTAILANDSIVSFNGRGRKATSWSDTVGGFYIYANENWTDAATGTFISFRGVNNGSTTVNEWMRISQGNVGIGTTSPSRKLVVSQNVGSNSGTSLLSGIETVINPNVDSTQGLFIYKNDGFERGFKLIQSGSNDLDSFFKITSSNAGFEADRVVVKRLNGYVGINQTNPTALLNIKAEDALGNPVFRIRNSTDSANIWEILGNGQIVKGANTVIVPSVQSTASTATLTPVSGNDLVAVTAQAEALNIANPTGTWANGQSFLIRLRDNGTARAITYGGLYRAIGVTLPIATNASKTVYLGVVFNQAENTFDVIGVSTQA